MSDFLDMGTVLFNSEETMHLRLEVWLVLALLFGCHALLYAYRERFSAWMNSIPVFPFSAGLGAFVQFLLLFTPLNSRAFIYFHF